MDIVINIEDPEPIFTQLVNQVKAAVQSQAIKPGDPLPSIRQLASDLDLNNKTVAKAYKLLERDSVIQTRGYRGTFVHPDAQKNSNVDLTHWVHKELSQLISRFRQAGVTDSEMRVAFGDALNERMKQE